ncbi:MAG: glucose 1-dehydrogenase [Anaerovoracaceae bacterium]
MKEALRNKVVLVTGAGSGIGAVSAKAIAQAGAQVIISDIDEKGASETLKAIKDDGLNADFIRADVSSEKEVENLIKKIVERYGRLDGAFNNAGIGMNNKPVHELTEKEWNRVINIDLNGVFYCVKHEFKAMLKCGGGSIVNAASAAGLRAQINASDYVAAKHGVVGLTKAAAIDGGPSNIRVNAVCPGLIMTPLARELMNDEVFSKSLDGIKSRHIIGRLGEPEEVANAVIWLLSDYTKFITGTPLTVDGGYSV